MSLSSVDVGICKSYLEIKIVSRQIRRHAHVFFSELGISNLALFFFTQRAIWKS